MSSLPPKADYRSIKYFLLSYGGGMLLFAVVILIGVLIGG